jgi:hypothetical protein
LIAQAPKAIATPRAGRFERDTQGAQGAENGEGEGPFVTPHHPHRDVEDFSDIQLDDPVAALQQQMAEMQRRLEAAEKRADDAERYSGGFGRMTGGFGRTSEMNSFNTDGRQVYKLHGPFRSVKTEAPAVNDARRMY